MVAAAQRLHLSSSSALLLAAAAGVVFVVMSQMLCKTRNLARVCYWIGSAVTTALLALGMELAGRPARQILLAIGLCVLVAVGFAYFVGWQLRIGGQTRSLFVKNTLPDPPEDDDDLRPAAPPPPPATSYNGVITAEGFWWIAVVLTLIVAANVYLFGWAWQSVLGAIFLTAAGTLAGADDASRGHRAARGQNIQAAVAAIASLMLWALPALGYAAGYQFAKRRPLGKRSHYERQPRR